MITHKFEIDGWKITGYYYDDDLDLDEILDSLHKLNCIYLKEAYQTLTENEYNYGITYSNLLEQESIIVIGNCTSEDELINTMVHESRHVQQHIAMARCLDQNSEDVCYLLGKICQSIYKEYKYYNLL